MSSYIMHICVSDIVKRKLNLTDKFVYGSILPDNLKNITSDRNGTHYIEHVIVDSDRRNLPNIHKAINELDIQDKEIKAGYIAHLVEDLIWFNEFIPTYAKCISNNEVIYLQDNIIHKMEEFNKDIYSDYSNSTGYIINKCRVDITKLLGNLTDVIQDEKHIKLLKDNTNYPLVGDVTSNKFMTKESIDKYIEQCTKEVEKVVLELIGENK